MIKWLQDKYETKGKMKVSCGKVHYYLGMKLDFIEKGKVKVDMVDYTTKIIEGYLEVITGGAVTPACKHLFKVDQECAKLPEELA